MDRFLKPVKPAGNPSKSTSGNRPHPYKSKEDLLKEKCCTPRPMGNVFTSSCTGHQVSQGSGGRATSYFVSRNMKLARQFNQSNVSLCGPPSIANSPSATLVSDSMSGASSGFSSGTSSGSSEPLTEISSSATQPSLAIFRNCSVYINGYMGPLVSDIELKKRLSRHGARVVTNFGRRSVTHVILGPNGLAGGKIQKEMLARKIGVKYVTVDWYVY
jgi:twin BRCT domain